MTESAIAYSQLASSTEAGLDLSRQIAAKLGGQVPDAVIVFASPSHDAQALLATLQEHCKPKTLMGSTSAGEFTDRYRAEGSVCALALKSNNMIFNCTLAKNIGADHEEAARRLAAAFRGPKERDYPYRSALILIDALAGHTDQFIDRLTVLTGGNYSFFGGGAGDDARFSRTHVFCGTEVAADAVVALELISKSPIGIGVKHGWTPAGPPLRVTDADGLKLISLNGLPAAEAFEAHAAQSGRTFDRKDPIPFFLHSIIGIELPDGEYRLRVPLSVNADGSLQCASEVPRGAVVRIMKSSAESASLAAAHATRSAIEGLHGKQPKVALFFDCVATRLRLGDVFGLELNTVREMLNGAGFVGCNTYGQVSRAPGQFSGFHNCTAVVCVLPEG